MSGDFDAVLAHRMGERGWAVPTLVCCGCGGPAQGNVSCDDGEICDKCDAEWSKEPTPAPAPYTVATLPGIIDDMPFGC